MIRFLIRTAIYFASALIGIIAADLILSGFSVSGWTSYVVVAIVYALIQALISPLLGQMAERNASAFMGGIGLISAFVSLFVTNLLLNSLTIDGAVTWIAAARHRVALRRDRCVHPAVLRGQEGGQRAPRLTPARHRTHCRRPPPRGRPFASGVRRAR